MNQQVGIISNQEIGCILAQTFGREEVSVSLFPEGVEFHDSEEQVLFCNQYNQGNVSVMLDLEAFLLSLESPKRIFLVGDGEHFTEEILGKIISHLEPGDILVDLCDAKFSAVLPRVQQIKEIGAHYLSTGLLQGDHAIDNGFTLLPGGSFQAYDAVREILMVLCAKMDGNFYCCPYIGPDGSGQYVKMVHDGLAAALLQIYVEAIAMTRTVLGCDSDTLAELLSEWHDRECGSFLLDVLCQVVRKYDPETGKNMIDVVMDRVETGANLNWMLENALSLSVPVPTIYATKEMNAFSRMKNERIASSKLLKPIPVRALDSLSKKAFLEEIQHTVYLATLCALAQSFALLKKASDYYAWELNLLSIAKAYQGSSYVRSEALFRVIEALDRKSDLNNLFMDPYFKSIAENYSVDLRSFVKRGISIGLPVPCFTSCIDYLDSYRALVLPAGTASLVWDFVLGSGFARNDRNGTFHGKWHSPDRYLDTDMLE